jgi:hypothetical protein
VRDNLQVAVKIALVVLTSIAAIAASWSYFSSRSGRRSQVILFATIGNKPFLDYVYRICPDGSGVRAVFSPRRGHSYLYASGNSLRDKLIVTVHETNFTGEVADYLYVNHVSTGEWRRLITEAGYEGKGVMSPDGSKVVYTLAPEEKRASRRLWVTDLDTSRTRQLTSPQEGSWDGNPMWWPDGQGVAFLRSHYTTEGIFSNLLSVSLSGGEPTTLLGPDVPVAAFCYAPDGKRLAIWGKEGLELLDTSGEPRTLILPWSKLANYAYRGGGLAWSGIQDQIVLALFNKQSNQDELWTISSNGEDLRRIYSHKDGRIILCSFIRE